MPTEPLAPDAPLPGREIFDALEQSHCELGDGLHDSLCQTLSGAALMAQVLARRAATEGAANAGDLARLSEMLDRSMDGARALLHRLQPLDSSPTALMTALERLCADTTRTVPCEFRCAEPVAVPDAAAGLALFRIAEAAVQNALGSTPAARLRIALAASGGAVQVTISTDGAKAADGLVEARRWKLMHHRAAAAGAILKSEQWADGRTKVTCRLPPESEL